MMLEERLSWVSRRPLAGRIYVEDDFDVYAGAEVRLSDDGRFIVNGLNPPLPPEIEFRRGELAIDVASADRDGVHASGIEMLLLFDPRTYLTASAAIDETFAETQEGFDCFVVFRVRELFRTIGVH